MKYDELAGNKVMTFSEVASAAGISLSLLCDVRYRAAQVRMLFLFHSAEGVSEALITIHGWSRAQALLRVA